MSKIYDKITFFLENAQRVITNAQNNSLLRDALEEFGYDHSRFEEGEKLLINAQNLVSQQMEELGENLGMAPELMEAWDEAEKIYTLYRRLARIAIRRYTGKEKPILINQKKRLSLSGWLYQTEVFYTNTLNKTYILEALGRFNLTPEKLKRGQDLVRKVADLNLKQDRAGGSEKESAIEVDVALDMLDDWILELYDVSRAIFADSPEKIEALGHYPGF